MHPATEKLLRWFDYTHLAPGKPRDTSQWIQTVAYKFARELPEDPETTVGLRKLLEAKDCFVRAAVRQTEEAAK